MLIFAIIYGVLLSTSAQLYGRYYAPLSFAVSFFSALGLFWLAYSVKPKAVQLVLGFVILAIFAYPAIRNISGEIPRKEKRDDRRELTMFIQRHVAPEASIAYDALVFLPDPRHSARNPHQLSLPQRVFTLDWELPIALAGTLDELRAKGVTHVAVAGTKYVKYFQQHRVSDLSAEKIKRFYAELSGTKLLWESKSQIRLSNNRFPKFALYEIARTFQP
jgi:hypothetical protein